MKSRQIDKSNVIGRVNFCKSYRVQYVKILFVIICVSSELPIFMPNEILHTHCQRMYKNGQNFLDMEYLLYKLYVKNKKKMLKISCLCDSKDIFLN